MQVQCTGKRRAFKDPSYFIMTLGIPPDGGGKRQNLCLARVSLGDRESPHYDSYTDCRVPFEELGRTLNLVDRPSGEREIRECQWDRLWFVVACRLGRIGKNCISLDFEVRISDYEHRYA